MDPKLPGCLKVKLPAHALLATITPRERGELTSTWNLFQKDSRNNGVLLFYRFFQQYPDYQKLFSAFAKEPLSNLKENSFLIAHSNSVMYLFTAIIENMHDPACLTEMLLKTGRNHARDKTPTKGFQHFKVVMMDVLHTKLGPKMTPSASASWDKCLGLIFDVIAQGMRTSTSGTHFLPAEGMHSSDKSVSFT